MVTIGPNQRGYKWFNMCMVCTFPQDDGSSCATKRISSLTGKPLQFLAILYRLLMHLSLVLRPILILRVPSLQYSLGKLSLLTADGHAHECLFGVPHSLCQIGSLGLSLLPASLLLLPREGELYLADIHVRPFGLGFQMGVFGLHDGLGLVGELQSDLGLPLEEVDGGLGGGDIRLERALLQLQVLPLDFLLLELGLSLHVIDQEQILNGETSALFYLDIADLLALEEGLQFLAGLLAEGVGELAGGGECLRSEGQFLRSRGFTLFCHSFLIEELEIVHDESDLILGKVFTFLVESSCYNDGDELLDFLCPQSSKGILLPEDPNNLLGQLHHPQVHIEDLIQDGQGKDGVQLLALSVSLAGQLLELREYLPENEGIGVPVDLGRHHRIDLPPGGLDRHLFLLLSPSGVVVEQGANVGVADDRLRSGEDLGTEEILLWCGVAGGRAVPGEPVEDVVADATAMAGGDQLGIRIDLGGPGEGLLLVAIDLETQLLDLPLLGPLELLLVLDEPLNSPFLLPVGVDPRLEGALLVLLVCEGMGVGPFLGGMGEGVEGLLVGDRAAFGGAEGVVLCLGEAVEGIAREERQTGFVIIHDGGLILQWRQKGKERVSEMGGV